MNPTPSPLLLTLDPRWVIAAIALSVGLSVALVAWLVSRTAAAVPQQDRIWLDGAAAQALEQRHSGFSDAGADASAAAAPADGDTPPADAPSDDEAASAAPASAQADPPSAAVGPAPADASPADASPPDGTSPESPASASPRPAFDLQPDP